MDSLERRFADLLEHLRLLDLGKLTIEHLDELERHYTALNNELRATVAANSDRHDTLSNLSVRARSQIVDTRARLLIARETARIAAQREAHAAQHPTVLDRPVRRRGISRGR
ncbi:hypothetical protein OG225_06930 [Nocardia sp. NBC_01377]|uniref:hypothetical protein n=1 Tax=Nocardia sp. NBC_01377 TaxID=2903595 RepID=UPI003245374C